MRYEPKTITLKWDVPAGPNATRDGSVYTNTPLVTASIASEPVWVQNYSAYSTSVTVSGSNAVAFPQFVTQLQVSDDKGKKRLGTLDTVEDVTNYRILTGSRMVHSGNVITSASDISAYDTFFDAPVSSSFGTPKAHGTQGFINSNWLRMTVTNTSGGAGATIFVNLTLKDI